MSSDKEAKIRALEERLEKMEGNVKFLKNLLSHLDNQFEELKRKK